MNDPVRTEEDPELVAVTPLPAEGRIQVSAEEVTPSTVVIRASGDLDMLTAGAFHDALWPRFAAADERTIVLDLSGIGFLGSAGLAELVAARDTVSGNGVSLVLVASARTVLRPLEVTGLLPLFQVFESVEAALREV